MHDPLGQPQLLLTRSMEMVKIKVDSSAAEIVLPRGNLPHSRI